MAEQDRVPARIGVGDVVRLEAETERLRGLDYRHGGGSCRDSVIATAAWNDQLLRAKATATARSRLHVALADVHNLAGWTCFDTGLEQAATKHWDRALELGAVVGHQDLIANIHYRAGRMRLHNGRRRDALEVFDLGVVAAKRARSHHATAMLRANQAWAHAGLGDQGMALIRLRQAYEEFAQATVSAVPSWARFFDETDLSALTGVVHTELARTVDPCHTATAIPALTAAILGYPDGMTRSRALSLIALTANHLLDNDFAHADLVGRRAVAAAGRVSSIRVADRLQPLRHLAGRYRGDPHARQLAARIAAFTPVL
ncbi:tetratricopeptide (TPR) repeat protein [Saccharothrix tamanrassetensis]|uniref:Tetratricopeptide (TPR) repeat protein n=1 Tax=Saccharothrix tamanrassetensis TaxID=1051531 RepID=A0A841CXW5_9PSEU|nr:tetratricopeptide repeat protein [Saccharothrix tamanrassetensis]MBB5960186.1 tetratricopeptide (TPR) repeat protein [Saccharothrix tamanrassetensis]